MTLGTTVPTAGPSNDLRLISSSRFFTNPASRTIENDTTEVLTLPERSGHEPVQPLAGEIAPEAIDTGCFRDRAEFAAWVPQARAALTPAGIKLTETPAFDVLFRVENCTASLSHLFRHVTHNRAAHCIHAAHEGAHLGRRLGLSDYEVTVLEKVMLLHDAHRFGSHALDKFLYSFPGAPKISEYGWDPAEYHEHRAASLAQQDPGFKAALGALRADVVRVLACPDHRGYFDMTGTLSPERIAVLHRIQDNVDRNSYMVLDYLHSGIDPERVAQVQHEVETYGQNLFLHNNNLYLAGKRGSEAFDNIISARQFFREAITAHPAVCLVDAFFQHAVWSRYKELSEKGITPAHFYSTLLPKLTANQHWNLFNRQHLDILQSSQLGNGMAPDQIYVPLVTLSKSDLTTAGLNAINNKSYVRGDQSEQVLGYPRRDMTDFEYQVHWAMGRQGRMHEALVVITHDIEKIVSHHTAAERGDNLVDGQVTTLLAVSDNDEKIIVTARGVDDQGQPTDLQLLQKTVVAQLEKLGWVKNRDALLNPNYDIFRTLMRPEWFQDQYRPVRDPNAPIHRAKVAL